MGITHKIFVDTEFTDFENPALISIGLVCESGETFYREAVHNENKRSSFVTDTVAPLLEGNPVLPKAIATDLVAWLRQFPNPQLVFDYPHDGLLVARLLRIAGEGWQLPSLALLALVSGQQDAFDQEICRYFDANPQEWRHHALADARALQSAVHALSCKGESMTLIPFFDKPAAFSKGVTSNSNP